MLRWFAVATPGADAKIATAAALPLAAASGSEARIAQAAALSAPTVCHSDARIAQAAALLLATTPARPILIAGQNQREARHDNGDAAEDPLYQRVALVRVRKRG